MKCGIIMDKTELLHLNIGDCIKNQYENDRIYVVAEQMTFGAYQLRSIDNTLAEEYINPANCSYYHLLL